MRRKHRPVVKVVATFWVFTAVLLSLTEYRHHRFECVVLNSLAVGLVLLMNREW